MSYVPGMTSSTCAKLSTWELSDLPWRVCGSTSGMFRDLPDGLILQLVKRKAAELGMELDPKAPQQILDNSYMDDCIIGAARRTYYGRR